MITEGLDRLDGASYFTSLGMVSSFYQSDRGGGRINCICIAVYSIAMLGDALRTILSIGARNISIHCQRWVFTDHHALHGWCCLLYCTFDKHLDALQRQRIFRCFLQRQINTNTLCNPLLFLRLRGINTAELEWIESPKLCARWMDHFPRQSLSSTYYRTQ